MMLFLFLSLTPEKLLELVDKRSGPEVYTAIISMINHTYYGDVVKYKFLVKVDKNKGTLIDALEPSREAGRRMLLYGKSIWLYAPDIGRVIRLSLRERFFGSEFTNGDLMEKEYGKNYRPVELDSTDNLYLLTLEARTPEAPYSRIEMEVRKNTFIPSKLKLYALSGRLIRTMEMDSLKNFSGWRVATYMKVVNVINPEAYTEVIIQDLKPVKGFPPGTFNPEGLRR